VKKVVVQVEKSTSCLIWYIKNMVNIFVLLDKVIRTTGRSSNFCIKK
jgi:hypothetical protein